MGNIIEGCAHIYIYMILSCVSFYTLGTDAWAETARWEFRDYCLLLSSFDLKQSFVFYFLSTHSLLYTR